MNFTISLLKCPEKSFLREATKVLKKEGQEISKTLPSGTTVRYIRGKNIDARGFGDKYKLFKEVTKPDNTRYVTNTNVMNNNVFVNEIFYIEPHTSIPNYVLAYDKYYYTSQAGFYRIQDANGLDGRPDILKELLRKKLPPKDGSSNKRTHSAYENNSKRTQSSYNQQKAKTENAHTSQQSAKTPPNTGKITKEEFVNYMDEKIARLKRKELIDCKTLKDCEIRNLAKLFGISEDAMRKFNKTTKKRLLLKYHPDRNNGDKLSEKIFKIVNSLKCEN